MTRAVALAFALLVPACNCGPRPMIERPDAGGMCSGECLSGLISWRWSGGLAVPSHLYSIGPCHGFSVDGDGYCTGVVTCFDARINSLLADPVITAAGDAGTLFGRDPRPSGRHLMQVSTRGGTFHVGTCNTTSCPSQATELAALLKAISDDPPCQTFADGGFCSNECTSGTVTWQWIGGNTAFDLRSTLATCQRYTLEKLENGAVSATCSAEASCYASELNYAVEAAGIGSALTQHTLFGRDTRPADGQVLRVTAKGGWFEIGICDQMTSCPSEVTRLRKVLLAFDAQAPCSL